MKTTWYDFIKQEGISRNKSDDYLDAAANLAYYYRGIYPGRSNCKTRFMKYYEEHPEIIEKENKPMRQCDIDFEKKKVDLKKEMDQALFDLQTKLEEEKIRIRSEYNQKLLDLEREKHEAEIKEQSDEQAKALKALYDSYVAAGFTKTEAKEFVTLELKSDDR